MKKILLINLLISLTGAFTRLQGQSHYAYSAALDTVGSSGFYKILLSPDLIARCRADMADLRIMDHNDRQVPYVLRTERPFSSASGFTPLRIISNTRAQDSTTQIVIENISSGAIHTLMLLIKNLSVYRTCTISGSDDGHKWFVIREHIGLDASGTDSADRFIQEVSFPVSNYRYFKLILDDKGMLPMNVLEAGISSHNDRPGQYQQVPDPVIRQKDSNDRHSYVTIQYVQPYRIDRLILRIAGPALYKRQALIYDSENGVNSRVSQLILSPGDSVFNIPSVKTRRLILDIANGDNQPLLIKAAATAQLEQYLLAWLDAGGAYRLLAGNEAATLPQYDLAYFTDSLTRNPREITAGPLQQQPHAPGQTIANGGKGHPDLLLWSVLGAVLLLLIFFSAKMIKATERRRNEDRA